MSGRLSEQDRRILDQYLDLVLRSVANGSIDPAEARESLAKAIGLAASGNPSIAYFFESEMRAILDQVGRPR